VAKAAKLLLGQNRPRHKEKAVGWSSLVMLCCFCQRLLTGSGRRNFKWRYFVEIQAQKPTLIALAPVFMKVYLDDNVHTSPQKCGATVATPGSARERSACASLWSLSTHG